MTSRSGLAIGGVGLGSVIPTHSLEEFGASAGADITTPMTNAHAAMKDGDVLYVPSRHSTIDGSVLTWKCGASSGGIAVKGGVRMIGAGRRASIIECSYPGTARVKMFQPIGDAEFSDLGFKVGASVDRTAQPQVIFSSAAATRVSAYRCDFTGGFLSCVNTWQDATTDLHLEDCLFDGQLAGLASGGNRTTSMGLNHNGGGVIDLIRCRFNGLGSDATDRPFASHCFYIAPTVTLHADGCIFTNHIQGRLCQFYNGFVVIPPAIVGPDVLRDCIFGAYAAGASIGPYTMCETSEVKPTHYIDCYWQAQVCSSGSTVNVKGPDGTFTGCRFEGASTDPADYLGNPDGFPDSAYDAAGSWFNGVKV